MATGVGERIRNRRKELGLSQGELASRLGLKSKSTVCKIERGEDNLTTDTIAKYADALQTSPAYIMGWVSNPSPDYVNTKRGILEKANYMYEHPIVMPKNKEREKAMELYEKYKNAPENVRSAIETLLKSASQEP